MILHVLLSVLLAYPDEATALHKGHLDVGFVRPSVDDGLHREIVVAEPLMAALPASHRFARRQSVQLSSLCDDDFVITSRELVPVYHDIVLRTCREAGFVPNAPHEADQLHMVLAFVSMGCGVALVPAFARKIRTPRVTLAPLRPVSPTLETVIAWRSENASAALSDFVAVCRRVLSKSYAR